MHRVNGHLALCLIVGLAFAVTAARAEPTDMNELAENPQDLLGQDVEMKGVCVKGGRDGDVLGYECRTTNGVYVQADDIEPEEAKEKLEGDCAEGSCEVSVQFAPHSYTTSSAIEPDKSVVIYNAAKAKVSF